MATVIQPETTDPQAIELRRMLNGLDRSVVIGRHLDHIYQVRFNSSTKRFAKWLKTAVGINVQTAARQILLSRNEQLVRDAGIHRPWAAYEYLGLADSCPLTLIAPPEKL